MACQRSSVTLGRPWHTGTLAQYGIHKDMLRGFKRTKANVRSRSKIAKKKVKKYSAPVSKALSASVRPSAVSGSGTKQYARFVYVEKDIAISPGLGTCATQQFSLSSLNDPYFTGAGHQPTGFDQLMAIYEQYLVLQCKVTVWFSNTGASNTAAQLVGLTVSDSFNTSIDCRQYMENGNTVSRILSARQDGSNIGILTVDVDHSTTHGLTRSQYMSDDVYRGTFNSNPNENLCLNVWGQAIDATDTADIQICVQLEYFALLTGSRLNSLS